MVLLVLVLLWVKIASGFQGLFFFSRGYFYHCSLRGKKKRNNSRLKRASSWVLPGWNHAFHLWKTGLKGARRWTSGSRAFMVLPFSGSSVGRAKSWEGTTWAEASLKPAFGGSQKGISSPLTRWPCNLALFRWGNFCCTCPCIMWECHSAAISPMKRQRVKSSLMTSNCVQKTKAILRWVELSYPEVVFVQEQKWITMLWVCKTAPAPLLPGSPSGYPRLLRLSSSLLTSAQKLIFALVPEKHWGYLPPQNWGLSQFWWTISHQQLASILPPMSPPGWMCKNSSFYLSGWNHFSHKTDARDMCQCGGDSMWLVAESVLL